ncbi:hypothetical protein RJ639_030825 [Escallonia herrerae]|uniref:Autophagy-related protein 2 n=1 Tax=Escallonia herrerae TaxID=1293975 RepID=A0AA89BD83_9ASTE|nr:hypothetical protein RJ639_030825 [Escallonia herrerae]
MRARASRWNISDLMEWEEREREKRRRERGKAVKANIKENSCRFLGKILRELRRMAYESINDGLGKSAAALVQTPLKRYQRGVGVGSALATAVKAAPVAVIAPASAAARAAHCVLLGVRNRLASSLSLFYLLSKLIGHKKRRMAAKIRDRKGRKGEKKKGESYVKSEGIQAEISAFQGWWRCRGKSDDDARWVAVRWGGKNGCYGDEWAAKWS